MVEEFLKSMLPPSFRQGLRTYFREKFRADWEAVEKSLPRIPLTEKQVANCEVVLNRACLLSKLEKGGIVAEIGVDQGEFSDQILRIAEPAVLHLVDLWGSNRYNESVFNSVMARFSALIGSGQIKVHRKLSTDAAEDFLDAYFDWIYLDTDHSYGVTRDELRKYAPKVKLGGVIAGHDYTMGNWIRHSRYGVIEAVHEFCVEQGWELLCLTIEPTENQSFAIRRNQ